jgi:hypothetical protein
MFEWVSVLALSVAIGSALASRGALICLHLMPLDLMLLAFYVTGVSVILAIAAETVRRKEIESRGLWLYLIVALWLPAVMLLLRFLAILFRAVAN